MNSNIYDPTGLTRKILRLTGRKWLLRLVMPAMLLIAFSSCEKAEVAPATPTASTIRMADADPEMPVLKAVVTVKSATCGISYWPDRLLRVEGSNGLYLIPLMSDPDMIPDMEERFLITYQNTAAEEALAGDEENDLCMGAATYMNSAQAVHILFLEWLPKTQEGQEL